MVKFPLLTPFLITLALPLAHGQNAQPVTIQAEVKVGEKAAVNAGGFAVQIQGAQADAKSGNAPGQATSPGAKPIVQAPDVPAPKLMPTGEINAGFASRHEAFVAIAKENKAKLLFLGDSITAGWSGKKEIWESAFGKYTPANFGIGGDRTQHVLWRITNGELDGFTPKALVLMIGTNNSKDDTEEGIAAGIRKIVETIRTKSPETKLLLLAVFPRGEKAADNPQRTKLIAVNKRIAELHDNKTVFFLDIGAKFLEPDGSLSKEIMPDFLHLSTKGYQIWADAISPTLEKLMK